VARSPRQRKRPPPTPAGATDALRFAQDIRERCLQASGDAGLTLCDLLLEDARQVHDEGRLAGSSALAPSAWKVLVRVLEEWANRGERGGELFQWVAQLKGELRRIKRKPDLQILRDKETMTYGALARKYGCTVEAARKRVKRARERQAKEAQGYSSRNPS
jgi:hypothetical protein